MSFLRLSFFYEKGVNTGDKGNTGLPRFEVNN
jgi:hypothetical protein